MEKMNIPIKIQTTSFKKTNEKWIIYLKISLNEDFIVENAFLKERNGHDTILIKYGYPKKNKTIIQLEVDPTYIPFAAKTWDFYLTILVKNTTKKIRIKNPTYTTLKRVNNRLFSSYDNHTNILYPYFTVNGGLSMQYRKKVKVDHKKTTIIFKEYTALILYFLFKFYWDRKKIILIYEKFCQTAQDNSFYFFKHSLDHATSLNLYYVIDKSSSDYKYLLPYDKKVLNFLSLKHMIYLLACKCLVSSESKAHSYIWQEQRGFLKKIITIKKHVFLQHGVLGLKSVDSIFKKGKPTGTNFFITSSELEKNIVKEYFHYKEEEIIISGLARWDYLENVTLEKKQILILPTWRASLDGISKKEFMKSAFYNQYQQLISSKEIHELLLKHNLKIKFCLHPRIHQYIDSFKSDSSHIEFMKFGEKRINEMVMESSLLITDYSSIAWDMYYLNKPVLFFHFDKLKTGYLKKEYLFGDICKNSTELIDTLHDYIQNNFREKKMFSEKKQFLFKYVDKNNAKRILHAIISKELVLSKFPYLDFLKATDIYKATRYRFKN